MIGLRTAIVTCEISGYRPVDLLDRVRRSLQSSGISVETALRGDVVVIKETT